MSKNVHKKSTKKPEIIVNSTKSNNSKSSNTILRIISAFFLGFLIISIIIFTVSLKKLNLLAPWHIVLLFIAEILLLLLISYKLIISPKTTLVTRIILIIISALIGSLSLFGNHYAASTIKYLENITTEPSETPTSQETEFNDSPFIVYISGSDSRTTLNNNDRSDVNIVAVVNPRTSKILLVNIPRDYYVRLHGTTGNLDKLTHAGTYGIEMSKKTIEDLLGIEIDATVKVGFDAVETIVDTLGGIEIESDQAFTPHTDKSCYITTGTQQVNGACALAFSRERMAYETGDRHRGQNQQQVITKIIKKLSEPAYLLKLPEVFKSAEGLFQTSFSYQEITNLIKYQIAKRPSWEVESVSLDGSGAHMPTYSMGAQNLYVMVPDESTIEAAKIKIAEYLKDGEKVDENENL